MKIKLAAAVAVLAAMFAFSGAAQATLHLDQGESAYFSFTELTPVDPIAARPWMTGWSLNEEHAYTGYNLGLDYVDGNDSLHFEIFEDPGDPNPIYDHYASAWSSGLAVTTPAGWFQDLDGAVRLTMELDSVDIDCVFLETIYEGTLYSQTICPGPAVPEPATMLLLGGGLLGLAGLKRKRG